MKQKLFAVAAIGKNRVLGKDGLLPWPEMKCDHERLLDLAGNSPTIMGRNSYESPQRFLSKNHNLVLASKRIINLPDNCSTVSSKEEVFDFYKSEKEICVLGGQKVFKLFLPYLTNIYLTLIDTVAHGDAYFPCFSHEEWTLVKRETFASNNVNPLDYEFLEYERL